MERDGDFDIGVAYLDAAIENGGQQSGPHTALYRNLRFDRAQQGAVPQIFLARPGGADANGFSTAQILASPTIPVSYTLRDMSAWRVELEFSRAGGGQWEPAVPTTATQTLALGQGVHHYDWDLFESGVMGTLNAVSLRLTAYPDLRPHADGVAGSYEYGAYTTSSYPFRVRGTTVRVLRSDRPTQPAAAGAMIYHLPAGQDGGGLPIAPAPTSPPSVTDAQGYLQGEGALKPGDGILALAPISTTQSYRLYYTNGQPTQRGVDAWTISQPGTQVITVGPEHPLMLFNLTVALEWDASRDSRYLQRLQTEIQQTSQHLYDFTDGQVALGAVTIYQNGEQLDQADVVIHATNRMRPFASEGGIVLTPTIDPILPDITYYTGQVHIGADWSRYGDVGDGIDQDWSLVLAHELSHYLFYLEDTYLGLSPEQLLRPIATCVGSAMGDVYAPGNTEFIADPELWSQQCGDTLAAQELGRTEWETLRLWYPALHAPAETLEGPLDMTFALTTIKVVAPAASSPPIVEPMVYLTYPAGGENSADARAYLIKNNQQVVPLGSPIRAQGQILARGAVAGDRFCLFDWQRRHYGCDTLTASGQFIELHEDRGWAPLIQLSPVTTRTNQIYIDHLPPGLNLHARLFPDEGEPSPAITLTSSMDGYSGTLVTSQPSFSGHIQVWVAEAGSSQREMIIAYSIGGNPGYYRIGGGSRRDGGGYYRIGGAHALSPDGQMMFFTKQEFPLGHFYALQQMAQLPELPADKRVAGQGYRLVASPGTQVISGSVTFQYRGEDVLIAGLREESLRIAFWNGAYWRMLPTVQNTTYNMASAAGRGPGIYALLGARSTPMISGIAPALLTNNLTATLSLSGTNLLAPASLVLIESTTTYTLEAELLSSSSAQITLPLGLLAGNYRALFINGDGEATSAPDIGIYPPTQDCFAEQFDSGLGKWAMQGPWAVTTLADGVRVLDDSPGKTYDQAVPPATLLTSTLTLRPAVDLSTCTWPVLTFDHDYVFGEDDHGLVELSLDAGATWQSIADFSGPAHELDRRRPVFSEWQDAQLRPVQISLNTDHANSMRLRFSTVVDQRGADRGWIIDNLALRSHSRQVLYLPMITR
jgi:hypothetical protein